MSGIDGALVERHEVSRVAWLKRHFPELGDDAWFVDAAHWDERGVYFVDFKGSEEYDRPSAGNYAHAGHLRLTDRGIRVKIAFHDKEAFVADLAWSQHDASRAFWYPWNWDTVAT